MKACLINDDLAKSLEEKYKVELTNIDSILDFNQLDSYLNDLKTLSKKPLNKKQKLEFKSEVEGALTALNNVGKDTPEKVQKNRFYVDLRTSTTDAQFTRSFTVHQIDDFSDTFNSSFISLYNSKNLFKLFSREKEEQGLLGNENFKNKNLANVFQTFLLQKDEQAILENETREEDEKLPVTNLQKIEALRNIFNTQNVAYGDYNKDAETKLFYVEDVFPLIMDFLVYYYNEEFVPNIFDAIEKQMEEQYIGKTTSEKRYLNPLYKVISDNKDILVGTRLALEDLLDQLYSGDLSSTEKIKVINESAFNKIADRIMDVFSYSQKGFGGMQEIDSETITEDEDEKNIEASDDNKVTREGFSTTGNEKSGFDSSSTETKAILSSLFDYDNVDKKVVTNIYGLPTLLNPATTYKKLSQLLRGKIDYSDFYKKLVEESENYAFIDQLLSSYLLDPEQDMDKFFEENGPIKRAYLQKVKQAFLQDLSKDRVEAKEINISVTRKWKEKKPIDTVKVQVNDAKQKKSVTIINDAKTRFHQKYFKNKNLVFKDTLMDSNGFIRLTSILKAKEAFDRIQKNGGVNLSQGRILEILSIFGIAPSPGMKVRDLRALLTKSKGNEKVKKNKGFVDVDRFFGMLELKNEWFNKVFKEIQDKDVPKILFDIEIKINKAIGDYSSKRANEENINKLIVELNKINATELESVNFTEETNAIIKGFKSEVLIPLQSLLKVTKGGDIHVKRKDIKPLIRKFREDVSFALDEELKRLYIDSVNESTKAEYQKDILRSLTRLTSPMTQLKVAVPALYEKYAELESQFAIDDDGIIDFKKKPRFLIQSSNNLIIKANDLNNKNPRLLLRFPELDPARNLRMHSSYLFKQFYNIDANGNITPNTQSSIKVNINNILGIGTKSTVIESGGISINDLSEDDNLISSLNLLLYGGFQENNNVDKEAAYNTQYTGIDSKQYLPDDNEKKRLTTDFLMVPTSAITPLFESRVVEVLDPETKTISKKKYLNYADSNELLNNIGPIADMFKNYLTYFLLEYYEIEKGNLQYVKEEYDNLSKNYKGLGLFEKDSDKDPLYYIIDAKLKEKLKRLVLELNFTNESTEEKAEKINTIINKSTFKSKAEGSGYLEFKKGILNHLQSQVTAIMKSNSYIKNYAELNQLASTFKTESLPYYKDFSKVKPSKDSLDKKSNSKGIENKGFMQALLFTYVVNYELLAEEKMLMFNGEPMFVKESTSVKRANSSGSTGKYVLVDKFDIDYYNHPNNKEAFAFAKALNERLIKDGDPGLDMNLHKLDYNYKYGQVEDNEIESAVYKQLFDEFKQSAKLRFGNKFTNAELDKKAGTALKAYLKLNEADGYGVITLDWYKIFSELTETWSKEQNAVYMALSRGEKVPYSLLLVTFPVRKFQYAGSIFKSETKLPADGLHKFSLAPMFPNVKNNLSIKNENLIKEGKAYEIFASANKKEKLKNASKKDFFYDGDQSQRIIKELKANKDGKYDSGKQTLLAVTNLLKDQVHIDTEIKTKVIFARQLKRVGKTDLFENGVPFDFPDPEEGTRRKAWQELNKKQKRKASPVYDKYRSIIDNIQKINNIEEKNILEKLGVSISKEGFIDLIPEVGTKQLINTLKKELSKRAAQQKANSANTYVKLMGMEENSPEPDLEAFVNLKNLKSILKNIIEKATKFRKFNGSNLVQAPVTGMESASFSKENIGVDQTGYLSTYRYGPVKNKKKIKLLEIEYALELGKAKNDKEKKKIEEDYYEKFKELKATIKAEIMLTFSPEWEFLLGLEYKGEEIGTLNNLNKALKDKEWVEIHQDKISILAVRIPIQDPNSIEAFIVKEFLPTTAGAKIVVPSEIVAKSGGDFDIDKLIVYYFNVDKTTGEIPFDDSIEGLENKIIKGYFDLLRLPEMFYKLITANSVTVLKRDKDDLTSNEGIVDELTRIIGKQTVTYDNTDLRMPAFNVKQKTILQTAKDLLGHAATIRSNFEELKHAGTLLSNGYPITIKSFLTTQEREIIKDKKTIDKILEYKEKEVKIRFPFKLENGTAAYNTDEEDRLNISEIFNKDNISITEIISAIMNGLVDVASAAWIVVFNMNEELTSYNFLMLLSGTPSRFVFKLNNQKIIKDYIENKLALKKSPYKKAFNSNRSLKTTRLIGDTFNNIIEDFVTEENGKRTINDENLFILTETFRELGVKDNIIYNYLNTYIRTKENSEDKKLNDLLFRTNIEDILFDIQDKLEVEDFLSESDLTESLDKSYNEMYNIREDGQLDVRPLANQIKILASTIFMKPVAEGLTRSLQAIDYDKSQSENIHDVYTNTNNIRMLKAKGYFYNGAKEQNKLNKKSEVTGIPEEELENKTDTFSTLQRLHVAAPYNFSKLIKAVAEIVAPISENSTINQYAINFASQLTKNYFIKAEKKDAAIIAFKSDFLNYVVQNYGTIETLKGKDIVKENIVEYFVKNGIFVDKKTMVNGSEMVSDLLEDKSLANQLFGTLDTFSKFKSFDVFEDYLKPLKGKKISSVNDELDYVYKIGRNFRDLSPVEMDDYNKQMQIFKNTTLKINDVLQAFEENGETVMDQFVQLDEISSEEVYEALQAFKIKNNLGSLGNITDEDVQNLDKKVTDALYAFRNKANEVKDHTTKLLPYLSLLQSTASYSSSSISNLFIFDNHKIVKEALRNYKNQGQLQNKDVILENLQNFTIPFLLNNRTTLLTSNKEAELLKMIAGKEIETNENVLFKDNNLINNSDYFTNYYNKEFSLSDRNTDFSEAKSLTQVFAETGLGDSFLFKFLNEEDEKAVRTLTNDEFEAEFSDDDIGEEDEDSFNVIKIRGVEYYVDDNDQVFKKDIDGDKLIRRADLKNEILVNFYSNIDQLRQSSLSGGRKFYVLGDEANSKIINFEDYTKANLNATEKKMVREDRIEYKLNCK